MVEVLVKDLIDATTALAGLEDAAIGTPLTLPLGVVEAVTGTGKTRVGIEAAAEAIDDGFKVVVCVPTLVLQGQWHRELVRAGVKRVGLVGGGAQDRFDAHDVLRRH